MALAARVLDTIRRHALLRRGERVLVALSGGSDSVALLLLLRELASAGELTVAGVAHLNHGLRDAANEDEQFCRALAGSCDCRFDRSGRRSPPGGGHRYDRSRTPDGRRATSSLLAFPVNCRPMSWRPAIL